MSQRETVKADPVIEDKGSPSGSGNAAVDYFNSLPESVQRMLLDPDNHTNE